MVVSWRPADPGQLGANLSERHCLWTQMDPNLSNSPDCNHTSFKWKEWERGKPHVQFQRWNTHFKFNLKINIEEGLKHRYFVLFLASSINKQCKLPLLIQLSVRLHIQPTAVIQTWDVRRILPFAIIFLILCHQIPILQKAMCRRSYSQWPLLPSLLLPSALGSNQPDYFAGTGSEAKHSGAGMFLFPVSIKINHALGTI